MSRARWPRLACVAAAALAGCGSSPHLATPVARPTVAVEVSSAKPSPSGSAPATAAPARCRPATTTSVTASGRRVMVRYPATRPGRHPLIVALHGYDQLAAAFDNYTRISTVGVSLGAIVAVPQGLGGPPGWNVPDNPSLGPSDVRFLGSLIARLTATGCADPARVAIAGLSDGSDMAVTAACALGPKRVSSVLLVAASTGPSPACGAINVLQVHGTADPIDAYTGRAADSRRGFGSVKAAGAEKAFAEWSALAKCSGQRITTRADLREFTGVGCTKSIALIAVQGGGHTWPGAATRPELGVTTTSLTTRGLLSGVLGRSS